MWDVLTGRRDGKISLTSEVNGNIPSPFSNFTTLKDLFAKKGLNVNDLVSLSGKSKIFQQEINDIYISILTPNFFICTHFTITLK